MRGTAVLGAAVLVLGLCGGCASGPTANPRDPFEPFNRKMMEFNEGVDAVALKPVATFYRDFVPPTARTGVHNFFSNLTDVWSGVNSALQLKLHDAGENFLRFGVNSVFGFAGLLDLASELNIERHREDFGQTLGRWGIPPGPYLMLPLFGPSTVRDTVALAVDGKANPIHYANEWEVRWSLYLLRAVDARANLLRVTSVLGEAALDKYSFTRDAYLQRRGAEVFERRSPDGAGQVPRPSDGQSLPKDGSLPPMEELDAPPPAPAK
jgi:phospholipid-binding lipoprotein MlaA